MSSKNVTAARNRRAMHVERIGEQKSAKQKRWQALAWLSAEIRAEAAADEESALQRVLTWANDLNETNGKRARR